MPEMSSVVVRRAKRYAIALPARFVVHRPHAETVRFASAAPSIGGWHPADLLDFGAGGLGMLSPVFVPRRCLVRVQIAEPGVGWGEAEPLLDAVVTVQRVLMTDRRPAYLMGTEFTDALPGTSGQVRAMLRRLEPDDEGAEA